MVIELEDDKNVIKLLQDIGDSLRFLQKCLEEEPYKNAVIIISRDECFLKYAKDDDEMNHFLEKLAD